MKNPHLNQYLQQNLNLNRDENSKSIGEKKEERKEKEIREENEEEESKEENNQERLTKVGEKQKKRIKIGIESEIDHYLLKEPNLKSLTLEYTDGSFAKIGADALDYDSVLALKSQMSENLFKDVINFHNSNLGHVCFHFNTQMLRNSDFSFFLFIFFLLTLLKIKKILSF